MHSRSTRLQRTGAILALALTLTVAGVVGAQGQGVADDGNVEERIAQFWQRIDAMQPNDHLSSADLGQWAQNVIERDARARLTVADFRASTAAMQAALDRAGPAPVAAQPTPTPAPAEPTHFTFGGGTKIVGTDVPAGTYRMRTAPASSCYWSRLSGFGGTADDIIANAFGSGRAIITIAATDRGFDSQGCGTWSSDLSAVTTDPAASFVGGMFIVGVDIAPGTWQSDGSGTCYWSRLAGFSGTGADIIANDFGGGPSVVEIASTDEGFTSNGCGTWTKIG